MKLIKFLFIFCILSIVINGCSTLSEVSDTLRNTKNKTADEFLIKKKEPLTQPPDFQTMPEPGSIKNRAEKNQNSIEEILKTSQRQSDSFKSKSSSTEESILRQIKK